MSSEEIKGAILERLAERRPWAKEIRQRVETLERQMVEVKSTLRMHHDVVLDYVHSTTLRILFFPARIYRILRRLLRAAWIRLGGSKGAS